MQRLVIKVGSAVLTENGKIAHKRLDNLVELIIKLREEYEVILVSSGAVAAGFTVLQLDKKIIENKQALASIGQPLLINIYSTEFLKYEVICSQVLLEASLFKDEVRLSHAKEAINNLLKNNIVPIINENDVTAVEELVFGDNDQLAAYVSHYFDADLLTILTDIDGYYDTNPHIDKNAKLQKQVTTISQDELNAVDTANSEFATGGIVTKLKAADFLLKNNKKMFLTTGFNLSYAEDFLIKKNQTNGTVFSKHTESKNYIP